MRYLRRSDLDRISDSVVKIRQGGTIGTGFFVLPGVVASCQHVVDMNNLAELRVLWRDNSLPVSRVIPSPRPLTLDLVLIEVVEVNHPVLPIGSADVAVSEIFSFGFQYTERGYNGYSIWGTLAGYAIDSSGVEPQSLLLITEANVQPGASGAPLFSLEDGKVIGVVKRSNPDGGGYAVRIEDLQQLLSDILEKNSRLASELQFAPRSLIQYMRQVQLEHSHVAMVDLNRELRLEDIFVSLTLAPQSVTGAPLALNATGSLSSASDMGALEKIDARRDMGGPQRHYRQAEVPLGELISQRTAIIIGEPGAGKTTLLRHLLQRTCLGDIFVGRIPVFIKLANVKREPGCLSRFISDAYPASAEVLHEATAEGKAVYFLDGLDEISKNDFEIIIDEVARLAGEQNIVFLSCRSASFPKGRFSSVFKVFECVGFNVTQQRRFLRLWFSDKPQLAVRLERQLRTNKGVAGFSRNPLLLSFMAVVFENDSEFRLPVQRAELYSRMLDVLLGRRAAATQPDRLSRYRKLQFLHQLAFNLMSAGKEVITESDLLAKIESWQQESSDQRLRDLTPEIVLGVLVEQDGILAYAGLHSFRFMHLTLQEYLAARHIAEIGSWETVVADRRGDPRWEEVFKLLAGDLESAEADRFVELIWSRGAQGKHKAPLQQRLLAARCAGDLRKIAPATQRVLATELLVYMFEQRVDAVVNDAIAALAALCGSHASALDIVDEVISRQFGNEMPPYVLFRYILLLDLTASENSTEKLLQLLEQCIREAGKGETETLLAGSILIGLGHSGEVDLIRPLTPLLGNQSSYISASVALALIDLNGEVTDTTLHDGQFLTSYYGRVLAAAVSFRSASVESLRAMIYRVFCEQPDPMLQLAAGQNINADSLEPNMEFVTGLFDHCANGEAKARLLSLGWLLAYFDDTAFIEKLVFDQGRTLLQRCSALEALLHIQPWRSEELLNHLFDMNNATLTRSCLAILGRTGNIQGHATLMRRVRPGADEWLLKATINLFSQARSASTWKWLTEVLASTDFLSDIHLLALSILAFHGNDSILQQMRSYLDLQSPAHIRERIVVYQALARLGTESACDLVVSYLFEESDVAVITHAIEALGDLKMPQSEEALLVCVSSNRWPANWPPPAPPLRQGEQRPSDHRCLAAIIGLNKLASRRALGPLQAIFDDDKEADEARHAAYIAIRTISWTTGNGDDDSPAKGEPRPVRKWLWFTRRGVS